MHTDTDMPMCNYGTYVNTTAAAVATKMMTAATMMAATTRVLSFNRRYSR